MSGEAWPPGLVAYRRTPEFTLATTPAGLTRGHSTKAGVWAALTVLEGELIFRDLEQHSQRRLGQGTHGLIFPTRLHEIEPMEGVRFFVEFYAIPAEEPPAAPGGRSG